MWGQVKFRPDNTPDTVTIQHSPDGGTTWNDVAQIPVTNPKGFFQASIPATGGGLLRASVAGTPVTSLAQPAG